ncbi:hypothetical protein ANABIO32_37480 [Rossellomorea marisflavi]|uniref:hypothetical protein n=1 Tax=Rossellomorea marisflavi TaxID=189381 RepID=UPI0025CA0D46|nr:hypothetical protein [Rossellomorea marisflavi]GLI85985.1 hypothetical protein ANABIO32_37480 [Rossellomorea marisflavi]
MKKWKIGLSLILLLAGTIVFLLNYQTNEKKVASYVKEKYGEDSRIIDSRCDDCKKQKHNRIYTVQLTDQPFEVFEVWTNKKMIRLEVEGDNYAMGEPLKSFNSDLSHSKESDELKLYGFNKIHVTRFYDSDDSGVLEEPFVHDGNVALFMYDESQGNPGEKLLASAPVINAVNQELSSTGDTLTWVYVSDQSDYQTVHTNDMDGYKDVMKHVKRVDIKDLLKAEDVEDIRKSIVEGDTN